MPESVSVASCRVVSASSGAGRRTYAIVSAARRRGVHRRRREPARAQPIAHGARGVGFEDALLQASLRIHRFPAERRASFPCDAQRARRATSSRRRSIERRRGAGSSCRRASPRRAARSRRRRRGCRDGSHRRRAAARTRRCARESPCRCIRRSLARRERWRIAMPSRRAASARRPKARSPSRHTGHSVRTSRCASTPSRLDASRYGSTPMSARRVTALLASLVCNVASTRWPVSDACTAICAVSRSRISPIMITSGSCRRIARNARAKSSSMRGLTCVCATPSSAYSIGSSTVIMFTASARQAATAPRTASSSCPSRSGPSPARCRAARGSGGRSPPACRRSCRAR